MNIRIQVMANQARQAIQQVQGDIGKYSSAIAAANAKSAAGGSNIQAIGDKMIAAGSKMQWAGRQLTYNFTIPLAAAGIAGVKFANDNERAMTGLIKVYGDASMASAQIKSETNALGRSFEALSNIYGIARADVIGIGAAWAAAGSSGVALAKQTKLTMDTMILGELNAADATKSLIAIQAQYGFSTDQLSTAIAQLNNVENQTGTTMGDLITSMAASSGVAKNAGVDVAHLAAMTAALVPAAGTAAAAGNALKTIISRLLSPTSDAADLLKAMGIHTAAMSWQASDASTRLNILSQHFEKLSGAQKAVVSTALASRYQLNKFDTLMGAIANTASYYYKALDAANNKTQAFAQYNYELNKVLDSSPQKFARIKVMMQNTLADAMQPMLPVLTGLGIEIAQVFEAFNRLSPATQKLIVVVLLFLAVLGPIISKLGALRVLGGFLLKMFVSLIAPIFGAAAGMWELVAAIGAGAWGAVVAGITAMEAPLAMVGTALATVALGLIQAIVFATMFSVRFARALGLDFIFAVWRELWTRMLLYVGIAMSGISGLVMEGLGWLAAGVGAGLMPLASALDRGFTRLGFLISEAWYGSLVVIMTLTRFLMAQIQLIMATSGPMLAGAMQMVGTVLVAAWETVLFAITYVTTQWGPKLGAAMTAVGEFLSAVWAKAGTALIYVQETIWAAIETVTFAAGVAYNYVMLAIGEAAEVIWAGVQKALAVITALGSIDIMAVLKTLAAQIKFIWGVIAASAEGPWIAAAALIIVVLYGMRNQLHSIWNGIVNFFQGAVVQVQNAFNSLPQGVQNSLMAVVNVVASAAKAVYSWFSYLNPFAHHSPSLVENVTAGMAAIRREFGSLVQIKAPIDAAYASISKFKTATKNLLGNYASGQVKAGAASLQKSGASAGMINEYVGMGDQVAKLKDQQNALDTAIRGQTTTVANWQNAIDNANASLKDEKDKLSDLQLTAQAYSNQMSTLSTEIQRLTSAPLEGMKAMDDAIFSNQMQQKQLQLQMAQLENASVHGYASISDAVAALNGQIDTLLGKQADLRAKGAGSEVLGPITDQIKALQAQKGGLDGAAGQITIMNQQLNDLQKQGNILDLTKSLQFDPLTRQINDAANSMKELPFKDVLDGVTKDRAALEALTAKYNDVNRAIIAQQAVVDQKQAASDALQKSYDRENAKLTALKDVYGQVTQAIQDMNSAMQDAASAASAGASSTKKPTRTLQNFSDAAGANFPSVGGVGGVGREQIPGQALGADQSAAIDAFTKDTQAKMGGAFKGIDMFGPFKDMWKGFKNWWNGNVAPFFGGIGHLVSAPFKGIDNPFKKFFGNTDWKGILGKAFDTFKGVFKTVWNIAAVVWDLLGPEVKDTLQKVWDFFSRMWKELSGVFKDAGKMVKPFLEAMKNIWSFVSPVVKLFMGVLIAAIKVVWAAFNGVLGPVLTYISDMFHDLWQVVKGIIEFFTGIFTGNWKMVWQGVKDIFHGAIGVVLDTLKGLGSTIIGLLGGVIGGILGVMQEVGNNIWKGLKTGLTDGWRSVVTFVNKLWTGFIQFIKDILGIHSPSSIFNQIGKDILQGLVNGLNSMMSGVNKFFGGLPQAIIDAMGDIGSPLAKKAGDALKAMLDAFKAAWGDVTQWFKDRAKDITDFFGQPWSFGEWVMLGFASIVTLILIPALVGLGIQAVKSAAMIVGSWIAMGIQQAISIGESVVLFALYTGEWIAASAKATINAIKIAAAWAITQLGAYKAAATMVINGVIWAAQWALMAAKATLNAIKIAAAWLVAQLGADGAMVSFAIAVATTVWGWGAMAVSAGAAALEIAADWLIAMGPVGWVILAVLAVIAIFVIFWDKIKAGMKWLWDKAIHPVINWIVDGFKWLGDKLRGTNDSVMAGWHAVGAAFKWVWDHSIGWVASKIKDFLDNMPGWWRSAVNAVGKAWNGIMDLARKPIQWVIDVVWNNGLRSLWNSMNNLWGGKDISPFKFAQGGVLPGYTPGQDTHKFYSATGGRLDLSGGEAVMRPEFTKALGPELIQLFNMVARSKGVQGVRSLFDKLFGEKQTYAGGGVINLPGWMDAVLNVIPFGNQIKQIVSSIGGNGGAGMLGQGMWDFAGGLGGQIWGAVKNLIGDIGDLAKRLAANVGHGIAGAAKNTWGFITSGFDTGGIMASGSAGVNTSGRPERVLTPDQTERFDQLVNILDRLDLVALDARLGGSVASNAPVTYNVHNETTTININGDLSFPNIDNGDDADVFLRNLRDMAGGSRR